MSDDENTSEPKESTLCKSCGLCCTGHLFAWVRLKATELDASRALGLNVIRSDPRQRGFTQPCPVWKGQCTVYTSPHYPRVCRNYQCKLLRDMLADSISLPESLPIVQQALTMIRDVESFLPDSPNISFRERLISQMKQGNADSEFQLKANAVLDFFENQFGVNDFFDKLGEE